MARCDDASSSSTHSGNTIVGRCTPTSAGPNAFETRTRVFATSRHTQPLRSMRRRIAADASNNASTRDAHAHMVNSARSNVRGTADSVTTDQILAGASTTGSTRMTGALLVAGALHVSAVARTDTGAGDGFGRSHNSATTTDASVARVHSHRSDTSR